MKLKLFIGGLMLVCLPILCSAQGSRNTHPQTTASMAPAWASAHEYKNDKNVYFPDYYTFYNPVRGYICYSGGQWVSSKSAPAFMAKVDMNKARVHIFNEDAIPHPEENYNSYRDMYPAQKVATTVPVPAIK